MPTTADQYETLVNAIRTAGDAAYTAGDSGGVVVASDSKKFIVRAYAGAQCVAQMFRDLNANTPPLRTPGGGAIADGVCLVYADSVEVITITRARK